ncbi:Elongation factor Ts [Candidatus Westeberhardia cardiocondylae]|uniref:Elongation factor Ts n=1 Tax=Candidatus Westeberhardia cardiocondylae TaxID=1594731 RepID=A0A0H5BX92_9ENTR|nr:translation elongation factor Ts [Candidatus Westeberhardia cardiocondylae]CEN32284.1 Elongation factor Ts [Candidatus Westeberhardia cardiocondylae]
MLDIQKNITINLIKKLREKTGAGIMACKTALIKTNGNINSSINYMRKLGKINSYKRKNYTTSQGSIFIKISKENQYGIILEINCESDFVAQTKEFKEFGKKIVSEAIQKNITDIYIIKKKFNTQHTELINKVNENINIRRINIIQGNTLGYYLHGTKIGVIISATNINQQLIKQIAMHIVANTPEYINVTDIPKEIIENEKKIQSEIVSKLKKPSNISEKIIEGRMKKFVKDITLLEQSFIFNDKKKIKELLKENQSKINKFVYFKVGK